MSRLPRALWTRSPAKLNLDLRVVGRREDGYHLLDTVFHALALHDDVAVSLAPGEVRIAVTADAERLLVPADERNLVVRALRALQEAAGADAGFDVRLHKRIPNGGGLGGGSSNAAAALRIGNELLARPLDPAALAALALSLGADVPFFLRGGTLRGRGVGDELTDAAPVHAHFVLLAPAYGCETAAVYKLHAELAAHRGSDTVDRNCGVPVAAVDMFRGFRNDLEPAAMQLRPALRALRDAVGVLGFPTVRMSGSGSTLFVGFEDAAGAERCAATLRRALASGAHGLVDVLVTQSEAPSGSNLPSDAPDDAPDGGRDGSRGGDSLAPLSRDLPPHLHARPAT
ncbi:MAG: 4-(cytidine 5'-diphospho)-2-C-methyl-D-erythritol kinase [Planctomycetota bacterium]